MSGRFRTVFLKSGLSQAEFAERLGLGRQGQPQVGKWVCGKFNPSARNIIAICRTFNVSADWLLGLTDERRKPEGGETMGL